MDCCYLCTDCTASFSTLPELEAHMLAHGKITVAPSVGEDKIDVDEEATMSIDEEPLSQHSPSSSETSIEVKEESGLPTCKFCHATFEDRTELSTHLSLLHSDRTLYRCAQCPEVFSVKRELATHARLHSGEEPHECAQCGKQFGTRQLLKKHCMWHTGERSHVCPHCSKAFFQKGHLTQHLMIHAGGRPHVCNLCTKTFIFKFDLNRHMKIHAERGFCCGGCRRSFLKQSSLDEHTARCKASQPSSGFSSSPSTPSLSKDFPSSIFFSGGRADNPLAALDASFLPSTPPQQCLLCSARFSTTADLSAHLTMTHFGLSQLAQISAASLQSFDVKPSLFTSSALVSSPSSMMPDSSSSDDMAVDSQLEDGEIPKSGSLSAFLPIKMEEVDTATNSSCASSPQKASPLMPSSASPISHDCGEATRDADIPTPPMSFVKCGGCEDSAAKIAQKQEQIDTLEKQLSAYQNLLKMALRLPVASETPSPFPTFSTPSPQLPPPSFNLFSSLLNRPLPAMAPFSAANSLQSLLVNLQ